MLHAEMYHRARRILEIAGRAYPGAWHLAERFRQLRGRDGVPDWPQWCYLPLHAAYAIVSGGGDRRVPFERAHHVGILGALIAWRVTQGIYRYDPALYEDVRDTVLDRDLPVDPLYRLPEWCVYIETPDLVWTLAGEYRPIRGVWAHLDWDERIEGRPHHELRLVLDTARTPDEALDPLHGCIPIPLVLGAGTVADAIARVIESGAEQARRHGMEVPADLAGAERVAPALWPIVSLVLYLCADEADIGDGITRPSNPVPVSTRRRGEKIFPAQTPRVWDVGVSLGAALRRAYQDVQTRREPGPPTGRTVRPHIRRAHWHTFLSGPRSGERERRIRWLPPIPVRLSDPGELPSTIRRVTDDRS